MSKSLMQRLIDAGYPKEDMDHHNSDLYVYVTPLTTKIISEWCNENKYTMDWHCPDEHPDGILGKPCPVCGYQYGHAWQTEEVPQEVIDWLFALPDTPVKPAWV